MTILKSTTYVLTDLKACYDRQLANIGSIVEESIRRNRKEMLLYTKIMPRFEHYISTRYGLSKRYYGGANPLAGTSQGNKFSEDIFRDVSCLIIRQLEQKIGIVFLSVLALSKVIC